MFINTILCCRWTFHTSIYCTLSISPYPQMRLIHLASLSNSALLGMPAHHGTCNSRFPCHVRWLSRHQILFSTLWDNPHVSKAFSGGFLERQRRRMGRMVPCYGLCHCWDALDTVLRLSVAHEQFCPITDAYPVCLTAADCQSEGCQPSSVVTSLCLLGFLLTSNDLWKYYLWTY